MEDSAQQAVFRAQQVEIQARIATVSASHQLAHKLKNISSPAATPSPRPNSQQQILAASAEVEMNSIQEVEEDAWPEEAELSPPGAGTSPPGIGQPPPGVRAENEKEQEEGEKVF
jgi:hypothetical protein